MRSPTVPARTRPFISAALVLGLLAGTACRAGTDTVPADNPVVGAKTAIVAEAPFRETITAVGAVVPRIGSIAQLSAPAPTRVTGVMVVAGQAVASGTVLVALDQAPFLARATAADAALQAAERARARAQRLVEEGISPRKDLEQADAGVALARADSVAARRNAQLSRLQSPISGVVTRMSAVLGASVDANQPLVEIADPAAVDVLIAVSPDEAHRIRPGAPVTLAASQAGAPEALGTATVTEIGAMVDTSSRGIAVRARGTNLSRRLRIGETVAATILVADYARALQVPVEALVPEGEGFKVFVVDSGGIAHARAVAVGGRTPAMARVVSGLVAGDRIVTYGAYGVSDSARIVPPAGAKP